MDGAHNTMADAPDTSKDHPLDDRDLLRRFESLGGAVRGAEFGHFLHNAGVDALGLLSWADLAAKLLIDALEQRFEAVGDPETTIIFRPGHSSEWWTRDTRFWMAMRTHIQARSESPDEVAPAILERLRSLRDRLLADLREGRKLFVFRDLVHDLDAERLDRLHAAIRLYGPGTLFYLRYEDAAHPAGLVEAVKPGLLIGYVAHFAFSRQNQYIGPIDDVLLSLCRRAWTLHRTLSTPAEPPRDPSPDADPAQPPAPPIRQARPASRQILSVGNVQAEVPEEGLRLPEQGRHPEAVAPSRTEFTATPEDQAEHRDDTGATSPRRLAGERPQSAEKHARPPRPAVPPDAGEQPRPADERAASIGDMQRHGPPLAGLQQALKAAVVAPDNAEAYCNLGCLLRQAGDTVAAEQALQRALALRPEHAHYHHELSVLYLGSGRQPEALEAAEAAIAHEPTNLARRLYLADVLASGRAFERAREVLDATLARAPDPLPFRIMISDLFAQEGQTDEALTSARAITRDLPDNAQALGHLAHVEQLMGRSQDAEMHLRSALALEPHNGGLRQQLERLLQRPAA
jgi:Flp pilus assembly protein TadD